MGTKVDIIEEFQPEPGKYALEKVVFLFELEFLGAYNKTDSMYSRVGNKRTGMFINFWEIFQGALSYSGW